MARAKAGTAAKNVFCRDTDIAAGWVKYANRGTALEDLVQMVNARYAAQGLAFVFKVPEAWRCLGRTEKGFLCVPAPGVVDFIGIARGKPVAFDCKEVSKGLRFPFSRLPEHQFEFLRRWHESGGIAFLLVAFWQAGRIGLLQIDDVVQAYRAWQKGKGKASVAFQAFTLISGTANWLAALLNISEEGGEQIENA